VSSERRPAYAAIFELDGDPADVVRAMNAATESGEMHMRDAIDGSPFSMSAWKPRYEDPGGRTHLQSAG
jgi:hypothetical protein